MHDIMSSLGNGQHGRLLAHRSPLLCPRHWRNKSCWLELMWRLPLAQKEWGVLDHDVLLGQV